VVLHGPEQFLQAILTERLKEELEASLGEIEVLRFDGRAASVLDVLDECRSFGLMQQHKMVVVDDADTWIAEKNEPQREEESGGKAEGAESGQRRKIPKRELLARYVAAPTESTTLVLRASTWIPGKLDEPIKKVGVQRECKELTENEAAKWVRDRCRSKHGRSIEDEAIRELIARAGTGLGKLDAELAKLSAVDAEGGAIKADLVRQLVATTRAEKAAWSIQSRFVRVLSAEDEKDRRAAVEDTLQHIEELLTRSNVDVVPIRWAMTDLLRKLLIASRLAAEGANEWAISKQAKLWGETRDPIVSAARRLPPSRAATMLREAVEADFRGKSSQGDRELGLEMLTIRLAEMARGSN